MSRVRTHVHEVDLTLAYATHDQARRAMAWHYSHCLPTGKLVIVGAWEGEREELRVDWSGEEGIAVIPERFVGVVVFSRGASPWLGKRWNLDHTELCELTRVALRDHRAPTSSIVAGGLRMLRESNPGLRLVVSFADPHEGHHGGLYQATNWIYTGQSGRTIECFVDGRWQHVRGSYHKLRDSGLLEEFRAARSAMWDGAPAGIYATAQAAGLMRITEGKYRYVYPLDRGARRLAERFREPYPKPDTTTAPSPEPPTSEV